VADPPTPLADLMGAALIGLMREHRAAVARELAPLGLHVGQEMLLDALVRVEGATQADLARAMGIEAPTVTKMLQRLDGSGLLERRPDPADRRLIRVWPTAHARKLHTQMLHRWADVDARMLADLSADQVAAFRTVLAVMTTNLATTPTAPSRPIPGCAAPAIATSATDEGEPS
jgi:DNA-binding MarR family transcriptional regulator